MQFSPDELSTIAAALKSYSESDPLLHAADQRAIEERRKVWELRDRIEAAWKRQRSSAAY